MRVTVRLFARLRDITGASELVREIAPGATAGTVWRDLVREFPDLGAYERSLSAAINTDYARLSDAVHEGDEVAFLPPVSGGSAAPARAASPTDVAPARSGPANEPYV